LYRHGTATFEEPGAGILHAGIAVDAGETPRLLRCRLKYRKKVAIICLQFESENIDKSEMMNKKYLKIYEEEIANETI
jgi:hypothetical protein